MELRKIKYNQKFDFEQHKHNVYSQCGEDGIIQYLLDLMGVESGYFVEFGAWDGKHLSNSAHLAEKGWHGCFIEGDAERYRDLIANYGDNNKVVGLNAYVESQGENTLDKLLNSVNAPDDVAVLSIDIDGNDYHVWESFSEHTAAITVVEFNPTIPADVVYIQDNSQDVNFGSSVAAFWELAEKKGCELVAVTEWNAFFIPKALCQKYNIPAYKPNLIKSTTYESSIFHGYDGEVVMAGVDKLIWHGVPFDIDRMQVLPKHLRKIPVGQLEPYFEELQEFKTIKK